MKIYIARNGQKFGPFSQEQAATLMQNGEFSRFDFAWREGLPDWIHLELVLPPPTIKTAPPPERQPRQAPTRPRSSTAGNFSDFELLRIASRQKAILVLILVSLILFFIPHSIWVNVLSGILSLIFIYQLAAALRSSMAWLYALLSLVPLVGLIALFIVNSRATKTLKSHGVRVGLLGANDADLGAFRA